MSSSALNAVPLASPRQPDFIVIDLPAIVELFATTFDDLPEAIPGLPAVRMLIGTGALARAYVVQGIEITDGVVQLVGIDVDV